MEIKIINMKPKCSLYKSLSTARHNSSESLQNCSEFQETFVYASLILHA